MRVHELLYSSSFEHALREAAALVEPADGRPLAAHLVARDGVLTVTVPFIYGISIRVGGHFVGSTLGSSTAFLGQILDALERDDELPRLASQSSDQRIINESGCISGDEPADHAVLAAPLAGWTPVAKIDRDRFETLLGRADGRLMDALDRRARSATDNDASGEQDDELDDVAAVALSLPVEAWDLGDGTILRLPGSLVFAAAMIGGLGDMLVLFEQGPWLCLSNGIVEFMVATDARSWRVPID